MEPIDCRRGNDGLIAAGRRNRRDERLARAHYYCSTACMGCVRRRCQVQTIHHDYSIPQVQFVNCTGNIVRFVVHVVYSKILPLAVELPSKRLRWDDDSWEAKAMIWYYFEVVRFTLQDRCCTLPLVCGVQKCCSMIPVTVFAFALVSYPVVCIYKQSRNYRKCHAHFYAGKCKKGTHVIAMLNRSVTYFAQSNKISTEGHMAYSLTQEATSFDKKACVLALS